MSYATIKIASKPQQQTNHPALPKDNTFHSEDWAILSRFRHPRRIRQLHQHFPEAHAARRAAAMTI
ncbi:MAG: hypothetical protein V4724_10485 [Pseudomonadota bacterium]